MNNLTILEKADIVLAGLADKGGILKPAQAQRLIRLLAKESAILKSASIVPMVSLKQRISKIEFGSLRPSAEDTAGGSKPDPTLVEFDTKPFKIEVLLSDDDLADLEEDDIERGELRQAIMELMAEAIARDISEVVVNGDTKSGDSFLAVMDGVLVQATSNVVDAASNPINKDLLRDMLETLSSEHLRDKRVMRFLTSVDADIDCHNALLAERAIAVNDKFLEGNAPVSYSGVTIQPVPFFPENLGHGSDQTVILLCNPKNIYVGIWRQIHVESVKDASEGTLKIVVTLRFDTKYAEESGTCKCINVQL